MKAKVFQELEEFDFCEPSLHRCYPQLKEDTSFLHDYFDFLREAGNWRQIEAIF